MQITRDEAIIQMDAYRNQVNVLQAKVDRIIKQLSNITDLKVKDK